VFAILGGLLLGILLGLRHAFEPDHLAAVSTLVADSHSPRAGLFVGAVWGLGHTLGLLAVGAVLAILEKTLPPSVEQGFECAVAGMLILLGLRGLVRAAFAGSAGPTAPHRHGTELHVHPAWPDGHLHLRRWTFAPKPLAIGLVHGLAGSGALTALVLARMPTLSARLAYIGLFGIGSVVGMGMLTGLAGVSLHRLHAGARLNMVLLGSTGALSLVLGCWWGWTSVRALLAS
jgi:hypothetical protein